MDEDIDMLALCSIPYLGPLTQRRLIRAFGSPAGVFGASAAELASVEGISEKRAGAIKSFSGRDELEKKVARLRSEGVRALCHGTPGYPSVLGQMGEDAPMVVYVKGGVAVEDRFSIAVVGSRKATPYGISSAEALSQGLALMGFTVVSGLARGVDTAAHIGAVRCGGRSIAVLGSGIDVPYPAENRGLMERIARSGAVLSEFPPGTPPLKENFPRRNRIISGISMGVVVVEAGPKSGALITAEHALEQGKDVFSVPGNITSPNSEGTIRLLRQGAKAVSRAEDIVEELAPQLKGFIKKAREHPGGPPLSDEEKALCDIMGKEPLHVDLISRQSGMPPQKALAVLLGLELKGVVRQGRGKQFNLT